MPPADTMAMRKELAVARRNGELQGYTDEELLTETCVIRSTGRMRTGVA